MTQLIELAPELKVKLFSHNDLDGIGCGIVAQLAFPQADVTYCGYHNIDDRIKEFITEGKHNNYDFIFITDISVNSEVEALINESIPSDKIKLLDHHATALHLNSNDWAFVSPNGRMGINSGTNLLFEYLVMNDFFKRVIYRDALEIFVEKIRRYDSWEWKNVYNDTEASSLNDLFWLYGMKRFERTYINRLKCLDICVVSEGSWIGMYSDADTAVLQVDYNKKLAYIDRKEKQMFKGRLVGNDVGFVFAEQYISELGNELAERNPELEFIVILDLGNKKVSYRTVKNIDLGKDVAKQFGGGGHPKASGSQIDLDAVKMIIPMVFGSKKLVKQLVSLITGKGFIGKIGKLVDKVTK